MVKNMNNTGLPKRIQTDKIQTDCKPCELSDEIIKLMAGQRFIGVGVGGLYIRNDILEDGREYVLLYKRYHDPENNLLSIIGGSGKLFEDIKETLKKKFNKITNVNFEDITIGNVIKVNNHQKENKYHYLSPSYYIDIKNPENSLMWGIPQDTTDIRKRVYIVKIPKIDNSNVDITEDEKNKGIIGLNTIKDLKSTFERPLLFWFPIDKISNNGGLFAFTTREAIKSLNATNITFEKLIRNIKGL